MNNDRPRGPTSGPGDQPTSKERKLIPSQVDLQSYPLARRPEPNRAAWSQDVATIIAFDPGGTTGWSMMHVHPDALDPEFPDVGILSNIFEWSHGQIDCGSRKGNLATTLDPGISTDGENAGIQRMCDLIRAWPAAAVVIEGFTLRNQSKDQDLLSPQRLKAAVGFWMWQCRREYFVQSPAEGKVTATDARLKSWGLYDPHGGMNHARDADRHAITFLRRASTIDGLRKRAWPHLYVQSAEEEAASA